MNALNFKIGDVFSCVYNDKLRPSCEVIDTPAGRDYLTVLTGDGYRNLKYYGIRDMKTLTLVED